MIQSLSQCEGSPESKHIVLNLKGFDTSLLTSINFNIGNNKDLKTLLKTKLLEITFYYASEKLSLTWTSLDKHKKIGSRTFKIEYTNKVYYKVLT